MTRIILVRHGETTWNNSGRYQGQTDIPLSDAGVRQAELLAANFTYGKPTAVYASDLIRARKTAEILAAEFNLIVQTEPALREINFGTWEGLSYEEIGARWPDEIAKFFRAPDTMVIPQGETVALLQKRTVAVLKRIIERHADDEVAVVAHGAVLRALLCHALNIPLRYFWSIRQYNTAVSVLTFADGWYSAELINSTAHLGGQFAPSRT